MRRVVEFTEQGDIESSAINHYWYDAKTKEFYVRFTGSDSRVAGYKDVPDVTVDSFVNAVSHGSYYSRYIKGRYTGLNSDVDFTPRTVMSLSADGGLSITGNISSVKPIERTYRVYAVVEIADTYSATSVDDAIAAFRDDYEDHSLKVTRVEVLFD